MDIAIQLEGQDGLNWPRFQRVARAVEDLGFAGLYRSDHFTNPTPPDLDSLELWVSLTWLASHTQRIEFAPLVSPVSFRDPVFTARTALQVDDLSGGRLILGVGAGWQEREHASFGYDLLDIDRRFARFEEALQVITRLLRGDEPVSFAGEFYRLHDAILLPRPQRPGGPPVMIGGNGARRTLPLVARYADEWNCVFLTPARFVERNARLDELLRAQGRAPGVVRRTLYVGLVFGRDEAALQRKIASPPSDFAASFGATVAEIRAHGVLCGTLAQLREQAHAYAEAGVQRLILPWLDLDDLDGLEALAQAVL